MNTPHTHVWCEVCQAIRPIKIDDMHADDASGQYTDASDLMCAVCGFVIAMLYLPKPKTQAIETLRAAQKGAALDSWEPTAENINALPEPVRRYVHQLETLSDLAGLVREHALLKQQVRALLKKLGGSSD
jgi:hypothetical protein